MANDFPVLKLAAAQVSPAYLDREASVAVACKWIAEAGRQNVDVLGFGEAWLPAYPFWIFMGHPIYSAPFSRQLYANAVEIPSAATDALCRAAKEANVFVVMGLTERSGGSLYLAQIFISNEGKIVGHRRKLKPTHWERAIWGEGDGSDFFVVDSPYGNIGAFNCWEHLQPLNIMTMNALNEQIHVASWPAFAIYNKVDPSFSNEANVSASRAHAMMTQSFTIHVSAVVDEQTVDMLCGDDQSLRHLFEVGGGTSEIIAPGGGTIAKSPGPTFEGLIIGECDMGQIATAKMSNDSSGHYQRGDVFQLHFNPRPRRPFIMQTDEQSPEVNTSSGMASPGLPAIKPKPQQSRPEPVKAAVGKDATASKLPSKVKRTTA
jgi:nitrilase